MMKKLLFLQAKGIIICIFLSQQLHAQEPVHVKKIRKNTLKFEAGRMLTDELALSYERQLNPNISININAGLSSLFSGKRPNTGSSSISYSYPYKNKFKYYSSTTRAESDESRSSYWYFSLKGKYYLRKNKSTGFYLGGALFMINNTQHSYSYEKIVDNFTDEILLLNENKDATDHLSIKPSISLGYNILLSQNRLVIDPSIEILLGKSNSTPLYLNLGIGFLF